MQRAGFTTRVLMFGIPIVFDIVVSCINLFVIHPFFELVFLGQIFKYHLTNLGMGKVAILLLVSYMSIIIPISHNLIVLNTSSKHLELDDSGSIHTSSFKKIKFLCFLPKSPILGIQEVKII